jgi:hypothetical protein
MPLELLQMNIPYGYCQCGCGEKTKISPWNVQCHGYIAGQPRKYCKGHSNAKTPVYKDIIRRFWAKVSIKGPDDCWPYKFGKGRRGYGRTLKENHGHKLYVASRLAWEFTNGPILGGLNALHKCDNPPCCNPKHLFLGTHQDNAIDKINKGRGRNLKGSLVPVSKIKEQDAIDIRILHKQGILQKDLATQYGLCRQSISDILCQRTWKHV